MAVRIGLRRLLKEFKEIYDNQIEEANGQVKKSEIESSKLAKLAKKKKPNLEKLSDVEQNWYFLILKGIKEID